MLALPIAAGLQMVVRELRVELPGEEPAGDEAMRARDEKAEHIYEELTHGQTAAEAGVIAGELAQKLKETEAAGIDPQRRDSRDHAGPRGPQGRREKGLT